MPTSAGWKLGALGRFIPGGNLRAATPPLGDPGVLLNGPPIWLVDCCMLPVDAICVPGRPGLKPCTVGGVPCLDRENAFIFACMSEVRPLALVAGMGRRAAFTGPRGAEDALIVGAEESVGFRKEGGLGDSSGEPEDWEGTSSVPFVVFCTEVSAVGSSMVYGGLDTAAEAHVLCAMFASKDR